ncbi:Ribitol 2-dehydrogenase [Arcanobacterium haemolyticum]|uniref:Short-chain dehydrogenase/reductase SDR n=2 Tax=Arcanobacterium haemolyticum TaxID=28264 RepID=D7BKY6_ARCHD|nr:short-chain dehydrogenase/reductase SDR [Arcanobacterium haemolyticum DSM 20595]SPT75470.1 Ribitol 2-dehydrogenase [Arcanobacterium haemolyticum]SQH27851.1 Ribitol 2-dehydrogenase [Arcanobacterium haemolyticum]
MGAAFAQALAARGCDLVLVARNGERLAENAAVLHDTFGVNVAVLQADLSTRDGVDAVKQRLLDQTDPITVFVNNAGSGMYSPMATDDATQLRAGAELMALVPMELGGAAAFAMKQRHSGVIITTASVASLAPMGAYAAVKSFVRMWSESLAIEVGDYGVQVVAFLPGWVRTEFHQRSGVSTSSIPSWLWLDAQRVIDEALNDVERGKITTVPSKRFKTMAFFAKHAPQRLVHKAVKKLNKGRR